jgi:hypothetical protein
MTGQDPTKPLSDISWPKATARTIHGVGRLLEMIDVLPAVFPTEQHPLVRPLKIGVAADLHRRLSQPSGMTEGAAHAIAADVLRRYTASKEYRAAVAAPGAWRHDLDGNPVEPVSLDHAQFARGVQPRPPITTKETIHMQVLALKVTLPLTSDQLSPIGETVKSIDLQLDLGDGRPFIVPFSGKNYRRALRQVDELRATGAEVIVVMQGRLVAGHRIEQAGLAVQAKTPKGDS